MQDLSLVTDTLIGLITPAVQNSPLLGQANPKVSVTVSGQHPEQPPSDADCDLNLYLFHVSTDKFLANSFWAQQGQSGGPQGVQPIAFEPLCLDLWYMLSAQSKSSYNHEQQALGVAMAALHEHGTITIDTPTPPPNPISPSEASLVLESTTFDELSRLWQALGVPLRTTAQYRVSVVFTTPEPLPAPQPPVTAATLFAAPASPLGPPPQLYGTYRRVSYLAPGQPPTTREFDQAPASAAPAPAGVTGQEFWLRGDGLADTDRILLVTFGPGGAETSTDITDKWKVPLTPPNALPPVSGVPFLLRPPATPGDCPPPGRYELRLSRPSDPAAAPLGVPVNIAPRVDPTGGPVLAAAAGVYTITVANVPDSGAELRLGTVPLERITSGAAPAPGQWQSSAAATFAATATATATFAAPPDLAPGQYPVRLRAADIEADPALWVVVP